MRNLIIATIIAVSSIAAFVAPADAFTCRSYYIGNTQYTTCN